MFRSLIQFEFNTEETFVIWETIWEIIDGMYHS